MSSLPSQTAPVNEPSTQKNGSALWRRARQLAIVVGGSFMFMCLKAGLVAVIHALTALPAWLNYGIVTVSVSLLGWVYHSKLSFSVPMTRRSLRRYIEQAIALKLLDYAAYNGLVYLGGFREGFGPVWAVLVTSVFVFALRLILYVKYVFVVDTPPQNQQAPKEQTQSEPTQSEPTQSEPTQSEPTQSEPTQSEPVTNQSTIRELTSQLQTTDAEAAAVGTTEEFKGADSP